MNPSKRRLDLLMVERGLAESRARAQALIMAARVSVNGVTVTKAGHGATEDDEVEVAEPEHPWVGRGGIKLAHALQQFGISVAHLLCADIGASTGGFTDVLLHNGAAKVYAVDVGYGQLDQRLREDPRVEVRERVNARYLGPDDFPVPLDFVCIDVSFISLRLILPAAASILRSGGRLVALIKPQFEVGREGVGKGGIVRDETLRDEAVARVRAAAADSGLDVLGVIESPIRGAEGNVEYLMHCERSARAVT